MTDTVTHTVQVDSRDRDSPAQSANNYVMYMTEPVKDIKEVIIRDIQVPNSTYNVVDGKNEFTSVDNGVGDVTIEPGSYSGLDLASHIFDITTGQGKGASLMQIGTSFIAQGPKSLYLHNQLLHFVLTFSAGMEDLADTLGFNSIGAQTTIDTTVGTPHTYYKDDVTLQDNCPPQRPHCQPRQGQVLLLGN